MVIQCKDSLDGCEWVQVYDGGTVWSRITTAIKMSMLTGFIQS